MNTTGTSLTVQQRASVAIGGSEYEAELKEMASRSAGIVAISNRAGLQECHAARMGLKRTRLMIGDKARAATEDAKAFVAAVGVRAKELVSILTPEESRLGELQYGYEAEQERLKEEASRVGRERVNAILDRISEISALQFVAAGKPLSGAIQILEKLESVSIDDSYQEFAYRAVTVLQATKDAVRKIIEQIGAEEAAREKAEEDAAWRAAEAESARIAKAEKDAKRAAERKAEADRLAAERKAEADRLAAERAKLAAEKAEFDASRAAILAEIEAARKLAEEKDAAARAEAEKEDAIRRAQEAEEKRIADEEAARARAIITDKLERIAAECETLTPHQLDAVLLAIVKIRDKCGDLQDGEIDDSDRIHIDVAVSILPCF
jgi:hypothetical protein